MTTTTGTASAPDSRRKLRLTTLFAGVSDKLKGSTTKFANKTNSNVLPAAEKVGRAKPVEGIFKSAQDAAHKGGYTLTAEQIEQTIANAAKGS
jgi:hypothetical protein